MSQRRTSRMILHLEASAILYLRYTIAERWWFLYLHDQIDVLLSAEFRLLLPLRTSWDDNIPSTSPPSSYRSPYNLIRLRCRNYPLCDRQGGLRFCRNPRTESKLLAQISRKSKTLRPRTTPHWGLLYKSCRREKAGCREIVISLQWIALLSKEIHVTYVHDKSSWLYGCPHRMHNATGGILYSFLRSR